MKWEAEKWLYLVVFSDLKNNKNSKSYGCSNKAKTRVFRTFRLGLLKNLTWLSNSDPGFGFYAKNYFRKNLQLFQNKIMQTCVIETNIYLFIFIFIALRTNSNLNLSNVKHWTPVITFLRFFTKKFSSSGFETFTIINLYYTFYQ